MASCSVEEKELESCIEEVILFIFSINFGSIFTFSELRGQKKNLHIQIEVFFKVMKAVDKDGDGEISKEEFVTHAFESDVIRNIL